MSLIDMDKWEDAVSPTLMYFLENAALLIDNVKKKYLEFKTDNESETYEKLYKWMDNTFPEDEYLLEIYDYTKHYIEKARNDTDGVFHEVFKHSWKAPVEEDLNIKELISDCAYEILYYRDYEKRERELEAEDILYNRYGENSL